jgi:hypothetical protein
VSHKKGVLDKDAGLEQRTEGLKAKRRDHILEMEGFLNNLGLVFGTCNPNFNEKHKRKALQKDSV